jgi:putative Mg2+ transporter-C (MgtC) family protein
VAIVLLCIDGRSQYDAHVRSMLGLLARIDVGLDLKVLGRIALASLLGYVIGYERELRGSPAGDRTFALVALGAAGVTALGVVDFPASAEKVIAGVVTGIGFLGAGLILRGEMGVVRGLTTAAALWAAAAVAILIGAGDILVGLGAAVLVLLILEMQYIPPLRGLAAETRRQRRAREEASGPHESS